jgi:hypothetical protein
LVAPLDPARGKRESKVSEESGLKGVDPSPLVFAQVLILKTDKVLCFDALSQVFILKDLGVCTF